MATELNVWCDLHLGKGERVTGEPHTFSLDGQTYDLDLCAADTVVMAANVEAWRAAARKIRAKHNGTR